MDVYDGGKWVVGLDRAIGQNADQLCTKRALDTDFASGDIGKIRLRDGASELEQIGAALRQRIGGQRQLWPQRERIAQFGINKF
jgi:hypothetical protein